MVPPDLEEAKRDFEAVLAMGAYKAGSELARGLERLPAEECYWLGRSASSVRRRIGQRLRRCQDLESLRLAAETNLAEPQLSAMIESHYLFHLQMRRSGDTGHRRAAVD